MEERKMKKLIAAMVALAMMATISTAVLAVDVPSGTPGDVLTTTSQTDAYSVDIAWGDMTFAYDFGTWDTATHKWTGEKWATAGFDGTKDKITVANNSSQPVNATFSYSNAAATGDTTTGAFTPVSGAGNVIPSGTLTGTMELALCPVDGPAPTNNTFLNLVGRPRTSIGTTAVKIGTITVTLSTVS